MIRVVYHRTVRARAATSLRLASYRAAYLVQAAACGQARLAYALQTDSPSRLHWFQSDPCDRTAIDRSTQANWRERIPLTDTAVRRSFPDVASATPAESHYGRTGDSVRKSASLLRPVSQNGALQKDS